MTSLTAVEVVAKGSEKKGTTKDTKSTKKSFSFPSWPSCSSWFKAFMLFATFEAVVKGPRGSISHRTSSRILKIA